MHDETVWKASRQTGVGREEVACHLSFVSSREQAVKPLVSSHELDHRRGRFRSVAFWFPITPRRDGIRLVHEDDSAVEVGYQKRSRACHRLTLVLSHKLCTSSSRHTISHE